MVSLGTKPQAKCSSRLYGHACQHTAGRRACQWDVRAGGRGRRSRSSISAAASVPHDLIVGTPHPLWLARARLAGLCVWRRRIGRAWRGCAGAGAQSAPQPAMPNHLQGPKPESCICMHLAGLCAWRGRSGGARHEGAREQMRSQRRSQQYPTTCKVRNLNLACARTLPGCAPGAGGVEERGMGRRGSRCAVSAAASNTQQLARSET